jgi:hypothetical protein
LEVKAQFGEERRKFFMQECIADLASLISCVTHEVGCRNTQQSQQDWKQQYFFDISSSVAFYLYAYSGTKHSLLLY